MQQHRSHLPPIPRSFNFSRAVHKHFCFFSQFYTDPDSVLMGFRIPSVILHAKQILKLQRNQSSVPKGHIAVYVGEVQRKRFVVPIALLNHPSFVDLLNRAKEEFGYHHPMGGLTIPCEEEAFIVLASSLNAY